MNKNKNNKILAEEEILQKIREEKHKKIYMLISNIVRIILLVILIRTIKIQSYNDSFIITLTILLTYYPSILEHKFGVYLPATLQIVITLFIFATQYLRRSRRFL